jgi:hypothetical protein
MYGDVQKGWHDSPVEMTGVTLALGPGPDVGAQGAAPLLVGVEGQVQPDGAPSGSMGLSMPPMEQLREKESCPHRRCRKKPAVDGELP